MDEEECNTDDCKEIFGENDILMVNSFVPGHAEFSCSEQTYDVATAKDPVNLATGAYEDQLKLLITYIHDSNVNLSQLIQENQAGTITKYIYGQKLIVDECKGAKQSYH